MQEQAKVSKRLVIYVPGFDAREPAEHYRFFQREFRRSCELFGLTGEIGDPQDNSKRFTANWDVATNGDGWQVETDFALLRWDDIVREDLARPPWWKIVQMYRTIGVAILNGAYRRVLRANWRFGLFALVPLLLITAWIFLGTFFGVLCMNLVAALGAPELVSKIVGAVTGAGGFASILWLTEPLTGLLHRCDEAATTDQLANSKRKDVAQRMDTFAGNVVNLVSRSKADEVVIVGHGFGSVLSIDVLGRALVRDPALGRHGPRVALLTLGANLPVVGFDPEAKWFRNRLRQLATEPDIDWVDVQSRDDVLSFCPFDPVAGNDIVLEDDERRNPTVIEVSFRDLWKAGSSGLRRWRVVKNHAQYLMANERPGAAYDYTLICCGPLDLPTRATEPREAIASMVAKAGPDPDTSTRR